MPATHFTFLPSPCFRPPPSRMGTALMVKGITEFDSALFVMGNPVFLGRMRYPKLEENVFMLKKILSRKKQCVPCLTDMIRKVQ